MSIQITIDLPETISLTLPQDPKELAQQMRLAAAIKWYELQLISQTQAAEIVGMNSHDFEKVLNHFQVSSSPLENSKETKIREPLKFNKFNWKQWPPDSTFRREDLYDDHDY